MSGRSHIIDTTVPGGVPRVLWDVPPPPGPARIVSDLSDLVSAGERFGVIYPDPPWPYRKGAGRGNARQHYRLMSMADIRDLPVPDLCAKDCLLPLWTTAAFLGEAMDLIYHWGFRCDQGRVWAKPELGVGNRVRVGHEHLLLGRRGRIPSSKRPIHSVVIAPRTRHSEKPGIFRTIVELLAPDGPLLELFGRTAELGWTVFGDQVRDTLWSHGGQQRLRSVPARA